MAEQKRIRPYRCVRCGDRFTRHQPMHETVYDPRDWERNEDNR